MAVQHEVLVRADRRVGACRKYSDALALLDTIDEALLPDELDGHSHFFCRQTFDVGQFS